jgi:TfoX/Sxy family transcriptional regulator of competence genes
MAYNTELADRIREILVLQAPEATEKEMFGGIVFMVDEKMCVGVVKEQMMCRIDPEIEESLLEREACRPMDFTRKSMKGFIFVNEDGLNSREDLEYYIGLCLEFNPRAKASSKKKK